MPSTECPRCDKRVAMTTAGILVLLGSIGIFTIALLVYLARPTLIRTQTADGKAKVVAVEFSQEPLRLLPDKREAESIPSADLTPEQRAAWEKARASWDKKSKYVYFLSGVNRPKWEPKLGRDDVRHHFSKTLVGEPWELQSAIKLAQSLSKEPSIQIAVVVDLFSKRNPFPIAWYQTEGDEVKEIRNPSVVHRESLSSYLLEVQQNVGD